MISRDTSKEADHVVTLIYRNMSTAKKARLISDAMRKGQQLAMTGLRQQHPGVDDQEIWYLWAKQHLGEDLFRKAYRNG